MHQVYFYKNCLHFTRDQGSREGMEKGGQVRNKWMGTRIKWHLLDDRM